VLFLDSIRVHQQCQSGARLGTWRGSCPGQRVARSGAGRLVRTLSCCSSGKANKLSLDVSEDPGVPASDKANFSGRRYRWSKHTSVAQRGTNQRAIGREFKIDRRKVKHIIEK
jgi:hypothetical protein